jgi:ABC-type lipoprotein release transport system permease subunit
MNLLALLRYAFRNVTLNVRRSATASLGLALVIALLASVTFLRDSFRERAAVLRAQGPELTVQRLVAGRPSVVPRALTASILSIPGVKSVEARVWGYLFVPALQNNVVVVGISEAAPKLVPGDLAAGRDLDLTRHEMLAGNALASALGLRVGDTLALPPLGGAPALLNFVGMLHDQSDLIAGDTVFVSEGDARKLLAVPENDATDLAIRISNPSETTVIAKTIGELSPGLRTISRDVTKRIHEASYGRRAGLFFACALPALLILLLLFFDRVSTGSSQERRSIAIQKAVGWSTEEVLTTKLFETLLIASAGCTAGIVFAYVYVYGLQAPGLRAALGGASALSPSLHLTPSFGIAELLGLVSAAVVPFVAVSLVPSWRIASADPVATLRSE